MESEIHQHGCILSKVWYRSRFSDDKWCERQNISSVVEQMCNEADGKGDGLVVIGKCNLQVLQRLKQHYKSAVYVSRDASLGEMDEVICSGKKIAGCAVEYLVSLGHENIGYVGACHNEARYRGYIETMLENNLDVDTGYIIGAGQTEKDGYEAMEHFMESGRYPTGIYCSNDLAAIGMLKYLNKHKNRNYTPSIISSDGIEEAKYTTPMLTTVQVSREEMGKFAIYILLDRLQGGHSDNVKIELDCKLVIRDSCTFAQKSEWYYCI